MKKSKRKYKRARRLYLGYISALRLGLMPELKAEIGRYKTAEGWYRFYRQAEKEYRVNLSKIYLQDISAGAFVFNVADGFKKARRRRMQRHLTKSIILKTQDHRKCILRKCLL